MRTVLRIAAALTLSTLAGCISNGPRGGEAATNEGFTISVPGLETDIKQGNTQTVTVSLQRGDYFKQDVAVQIKSTAGVTVAPASVLIRASESPDLQVQITASKDAALGDYGIFVTGTPPKGEPTSANFNVKVIAQ
jgi:uncharacterized membrane protein